MRAFAAALLLLAGCDDFSLLSSQFGDATPPPDLAPPADYTPASDAPDDAAPDLATPPGCGDGMKDNAETDVDCGGPTCRPCDESRMCLVAPDCISRLCQANTCHRATCTDGILDGTETDVDCGGPDCPKCTAAKTCNRDLDCKSHGCVAGRCAASAPSFANGVPYAGGSSVWAIAGGDFNGDGVLDLAGLSPGDLAVDAILGKGDGTFGPLPLMSSDGTAVGLALRAGDLDGNGKLDVVIGAGTGGAFVGPTEVVVMIGSGDGRFQPHGGPYTQQSAVIDVPIGDFNNDNKVDVAAVMSGQVNILLGNGDATFNPGLSFPVEAGAAGGAAGDFDRDGKLDLAVATGSNVDVLLGKGDGTFAGYAGYGAGAMQTWVIAVDMNGDGILDLVTSSNGDSKVNVLLGKGNGTFKPAVSSAAGAFPQQVIAGDFDGDGKLDLATANTAGNDVTIMRGGGDGTVGAPTHFAVGLKPAALVAGDFNADHQLDLAVTAGGDNKIVVLLNNSQ